MQKKFATCDWCKKATFVQPLTYLDGYTNYCCDSCKQIALFDVKCFNNEELTMQKNKLLQKSAL
ncbi:hypothetical protein [Vibrio gallicus]|uniref:hypothetical protein n=1 Tax=Vibrio gallicus TaxID=190897 RepID=UPI0021C3FADD|nr:hypothetical protein [Vibrio gallicus]